MTLFGADVSQVVNEGLVQQSGCTYLLARAIMETRAIDPNFTLTARSARAAGMIPGGYHWLMPSGGADQAAQFLKLVSPFMDRAKGFVVWLDCESSSKDPNTGKPYHPDPTWDDALAWIAAFRAVSDWPIGLYGNAPFLRSFGIPAGALAAIPNLYLVIAAYPVRYASVTSVAQHYPGDADADWSVAIDGLAPRMWQFIGSTADESQSVDLSAFRGDMAALRKIAGVTEMAYMPSFVGDAAGTAKIVGAGHAIIYPDGHNIAVPAGTAFPVRALLKLSPPVPGGTGDRASVLEVVDGAGHIGYLLVGDTDWPAGKAPAAVAAKPVITLTIDGHPATVSF